VTGFDECFDFVIVGAGGGSMCAGLVMRAAGKSVLVLEKTDLIGGSTARSGGVMWIPNNRFMKRDGIDDGPELAAAYLNSLAGDPRADVPGASLERRRAYINEAPRMVDFLVAQGIRLTRISWWPDYYDERPGGSAPGRTVVSELFNVNDLGLWKQKLRPTFMAAPSPVHSASFEEMLQLFGVAQSWRVKMLAAKVVLRGVVARLTGKHWVAGGAALQGQMLRAALRAGVDVRTESPVKELIVEEGAVKGVVTVKDGHAWRVGARSGVLVNAGGFARNQRMRDRYQPGILAQWSLAAPGDTGEMIEEMIRRGAAIAQMEERVGCQITLPPGSEGNEYKPTAQRMTAAPHALLVDQSGIRYMNEGGSYSAYCKGMVERNKTVPAIPSWAVLDSQYMRKYMLAGTLAGSKKPQQWHDSGYLKSADTIEDLARQLKIEPATLKGTVERFNAFVAKNRDEDFHRGARAYDRWLGDPRHKPSETLGAISEPPFYALPVLPGDVGTYGGVVTDENARVLREDGSVIPGLYATGVSTASVMGRFYPGAGCSVGPAFTFGYIAAKHAGNINP
jgi:3-oxosteroid 1-dehydrogenase